MSFSGVRVARSLVFCVIFCRSLFVLFLFVHWVVCPLIYGSWLQFCPLSCLSFDLRILITILSIEFSVLWFTDPDYNFVHWVVCPLIYGSWLQFCPLSCLSFDLRILITILSIELSVLWFTDPDYNFVHWVVCPLIYGSWLQFCYLQTVLPDNFVLW